MLHRPETAFVVNDKEKRGYTEKQTGYRKQQGTLQAATGDCGTSIRHD